MLAPVSRVGPSHVRTLAQESVMQDTMGRRPATHVAGFAFGIVISSLVTQTGLTDEAATSAYPEPTVTVETVGFGSFVTGRWGVARASFVNPGDSPTSNLLVVTPQGSEGLQYARKIEIPARAAFDSICPVRLSNNAVNGSYEFQYLHFPGGVDDGVIRHQRFDGQIPTFSGIARNGPAGLSGWISDFHQPIGADDGIQQMLSAMRLEKYGDQTIVSSPAWDLTERSECLDPLDNLAVSDPELRRFPQACESIRLWVQRGGRLLILLDCTGSDVAELLIGDCLPLTVVGETSTNRVQLNLNPDYQLNQYPVRTVTREFQEPIRYVRVVPEAGETIWSVDGWPVAICARLGSGCVVVTTISASVFVQQESATPGKEATHGIIASSRRMHEALFNPRPAPLINESVAAKLAVRMIGYEIPSKRVALLFLMVFPVTLIVVCIVLQRRAVGEHLVWVLPAVAVLAAIPAVAFGLRIRAVAPPTIIETRVIQSSPGQSRLASDGYATVYVPEPTNLRVISETGSRLDVPAEVTHRDYKRLVWSGPAASSWENLNQPTGLRTFPVQAVHELKSPWRALATLDENGITGHLVIDDPAAKTDALLVGVGTDRMALTLDREGKFRGGASDVLPPGQFTKSALVSEEQVYRASLLESVFSSVNRLEPFPAESSLLFWDESQTPDLDIGEASARRKRSTLIAQTLALQPPEAGRMITIPSPLLPFRSIETSVGGISGAFDNTRRNWLPQESSGLILLEFLIPSACVPLEVEAADVLLLIRAASRVVTVESGLRDSLQRVAEMKSPLGTHSISLPVELIRESSLAGRLYLQISVSGLDASMKSESMTGEQDDSWQIKRVSLTLKGRRQ